MDYNAKAETPTTGTNPRDTIGYWLKWIRAAKDGKQTKRHWNDAKAAYREYENQPLTDSASSDMVGLERGNGVKTYPIYWAGCKSMEPAFYARTPKLVTRRAFDIDDPVATTACIIYERLAKYLMNLFDFDGTMTASVGSFIHADKATNQLVYSQTQKTEKVRVPLYASQDEQGQTIFSSETGIYDGEVLQDDKGYFFEQEIQTYDSQKITVKSVLYDEIIHTPEAKEFEEIKEIGLSFCMEYSDAVDRFGEEKASKFPWKTNTAYKRDDSDDKTSASPGQYIEGWEIWSKVTKKVYWVCEESRQDFLDVQNDPYELEGFFPIAPFIIGSKPSKSLYPTPAFIQVAATTEQLHKVYNKIFRLINAIRRRALVDGSVPELYAALVELGDNEFISVTNLNSILEKGGIANLVQYLPVQELVAAIGELTNLDNQFKNNFYEWFGVPDIIRGISDPIETAAAQQVKAESAHDRFKYSKKQVERLARNSIEMMCDLAFKVYDDQKMAEVTGYNYLQPDDKSRFFSALAMLRNDTARIIRIEVETDSTSFINEQREIQKRTAIGQLVTNGLQQIAQIGQGNPEFVSTALRAVLFTVNGIAEGKEFQDDIQSAINKLIESQNNPLPDAPPPPDYEGQRIQIEQVKIQGDQQLESQKLQLLAQKQQADIELESQRIQIEARKIEGEQQLKQLSTDLSATKEQFSQFIQQQTLELEKAATFTREREKLIEEDRLKREQELELAKHLTTQAQQLNQPVVAQKPVVINLKGDNMQMRSAKRRRVKMIRTPEGELIGESEELDD